MKRKQLIDCYAVNCIYYDKGECKLELVVIAEDEITKLPTCQNFYNKEEVTKNE